jgi:hypothetical protein
MSKEEQEARIALLQEYGSNARSWYNVLLTLAIVLFAPVQVRQLLELYRMCFYGFRLTLWGASLAAIASQAVFTALRAVANSNAAKKIVRIKMPEDFDFSKTYLETLRDLVDTEWNRRLGSWYGWILWTLITVPGFCFLLPRLVGVLFSCGQ